MHSAISYFAPGAQSVFFSVIHQVERLLSAAATESRHGLCRYGNAIDVIRKTGST